MHLLAPAGAPPLYDGVGFPDEPYRFVDPPPGYREPAAPPTPAHAVFQAAPSAPAGDEFVSSAESGPQVSLFLPAGSLTPPPGHSQVAVTATPVPLPEPLPAGQQWSNVYRVSLGGAVLASGTPAQIQLRNPTPQQPSPTFYVRQHGSWRALHTDRTGNDIYATSLEGAGDYVLAGNGRLDFAAASIYDEGNVGNVGVLVGSAGAVVVLMVFITVERRRSARRRRRRLSATPSPPDQ